MNTPTKTISLLASAALFTLTSLSAVETVPVGYISKEVNANADLKLGIPFKQPATFTSSVGSVASGTVTVSATVPDVTTAAHYLWVTSGPLLGSWFEVTASTGSSVTVAEDLETEGLVAGNTFQVVPFWTLDALFPSGGDIPASSDVFSPVAFILLNDITQVGIDLAPSSAFIYHDGTQGPAGWYDVDDLAGGVVGDSVVTPETYVTIRNVTGSLISVTMSGTVPDYTITNEIVSRSAGFQDNQIANPFPAGVTLSASNLFEDGVIRASSDVFAPLDVLLVFEGTPSGIDSSPTKAIIYHDGTQAAAGWYDLDDLAAGTIDLYELPEGGALIVRRAAGPDEVISWTPTIPYAVN